VPRVRAAWRLRDKILTVVLMGGVAAIWLYFTG